MKRGDFLSCRSLYFCIFPLRGPRMMPVSFEAHFQWPCTQGQGAVTLVDNPSEAGFSSGTLTFHSLDGCVLWGLEWWYVASHSADSDDLAQATLVIVCHCYAGTLAHWCPRLRHRPARKTFEEPGLTPYSQPRGSSHLGAAVTSILQVCPSSRAPLSHLPSSGWGSGNLTHLNTSCMRVSNLVGY